MSRDEHGRDLDRLPTTGEELDTVLAAAVELLRRANPRAVWIGVYERDDDDVYRLGMFDGCPTDHPFQLEGDWPAATAMRDGQPCRPSDPGTDLFVPLRHADRLDINGHAVWFATSSALETTTYDPSIHGDSAFCYLTKARLEPGQAVVVCPAAPGTTCNAIYTEEAWELAMKSATMRKCANCGFRPDESEWMPSAPRPRKKIDELLNALTDGQV